MFGVLWSNLNDWYGTLDPSTPIDKILAGAQGFLVESRFYTLLCLLFGVGFGIMLDRASGRGLDVKRVYYRRSLTLLGIGLVHGFLIWSGDILTIYALVAFGLVLFRDMSPRALLAWSLIMMTVVHGDIARILMYFAGLRYFVARAPYDTSNWIFGHGTISQVFQARADIFLDWHGRWPLTFYWSILGMFLLGFWAVRSGYLDRVLNDRATTWRSFRWSLLAAVAGTAGLFVIFKTLGFGGSYAPRDPRFWIPRRSLSSIFQQLSMIGAALVYACGLLLIVQRRASAAWVQGLAATGRMGLTTYLTQSIISTLVFYSYGLGFFGRAGFTGMFLFSITLFSVQMVVSVWWLKRFRFGPAEWLWRSLTYGRRQPMRLEAALS